jgi:hypothetical protein
LLGHPDTSGVSFKRCKTLNRKCCTTCLDISRAISSAIPVPA